MIGPCHIPYNPLNSSPGNAPLRCKVDPWFSTCKVFKIFVHSMFILKQNQQNTTTQLNTEIMTLVKHNNTTQHWDHDTSETNTQHWDHDTSETKHNSTLRSWHEWNTTTQLNTEIMTRVNPNTTQLNCIRKWSSKCITIICWIYLHNWTSIKAYG